MLLYLPLKLWSATIIESISEIMQQKQRFVNKVLDTCAGVTAFSQALPLTVVLCASRYRPFGQAARVSRDINIDRIRGFTYVTNSYSDNSAKTNIL